MKLYYAPGACSLASQIALAEAGIMAERIKVDIPTRRTDTGADFTTVNPKGYVPALVLNDGAVLTENVAILDWIALQDPSLGLGGPMGRSRLIEMLAFISSEIHKPFVRAIFPTGDADAKAALEMIDIRLAYLAGRLKSDFLFGSDFTVADAFLYVMLRWAISLGVTIPPPLTAFAERVAARPNVKTALEAEGLPLNSMP